MKHNIKAIRLYETLTLSERYDFENWLKAQLKKTESKDTALFEAIKHIKTYLSSANKQKTKLIWADWILDNPKPRGFDNSCTRLHEELDFFLLYQRKGTDFEILKQIELFYIYRERGIKKGKKKIIENLIDLAKDSREAYLHYSVEQLKYEEYVIMTQELTREEARMKLEETFYLHWLPEYILYACDIKKRNPSIDSFIKDNAELVKNHGIIRFYIALYEFTTQDISKLETEDIHHFYGLLEENYLKLPHDRRIDLYTLFNNKLGKWYSFEHTYSRLAVLLEYTKKGFEAKEKWFYVGKMVPFVNYFQWLSRCFAYYEQDRTEMRRLIQDIISRHKNDIAFVGNKAEELLQCKIDYYVGEKEKLIDLCKKVNSASFPEPLQKGEVILMQLKAGLVLAKSGKKSEETAFWKTATHKLESYSPPMNSSRSVILKQVKAEWCLWQMMRILTLPAIASKRKIKLLAKFYLKSWIKKQQKCELVFIDKVWYFEHIPPLMKGINLGSKG